MTAKPRYMDHAATSWPKPPEVLEAVQRFLREEAGNPGRGGHWLARRAAEQVRRSRLVLASFLGIKTPERLIFSSGATESLNMVLRHWPERGGLALVSPMEHNAVLRPLAARASRGEIELRCLRSDEYGRIDLEDLSTQMRGRQGLVCLNAASNVNGAIQPITEAGRLARAAGFRVLIDGAQWIGSRPFIVDDEAIDALAFPAHKGLLGITGIGALYLRPGLELAPPRLGGTGFGGLEMPESWPESMEAGTAHGVGLAALEAGLGVLVKRGLETYWRESQDKLGRLVESLSQMAGVEVWSPAVAGQEAMPVFGLSIDGYSSEELAGVLDGEFQIACRAGFHCAPWAHERLGSGTGLARLSFGFTSEAEDPEALISAVAEISG